MIAERMKAYNLIDSISDDKMLLVVNILEAFKKSEEFSHAKKSKTPLFPYKEESAREDYRTALLNDTFVIPTDIDADEYVRELRKDERIPVNDCDLFLTNDKQLRQFKELNCVTVEEFEIK